VTIRTQAAIARSPEAPLLIDEVTLDDPGPGEVRVRIDACGICRSDLSALEGKETVAFPVVLGHEAAGRVEAVGAGTRLREGDPVVLSWTPHCGVCAGCRRGTPQLCEGVTMTVAETGPLRWRGEHIDRFMALGAFAEHVVVPERMAIPLSTSLPAELRCLLGCAVTTGFGAAVNTAAVRWGEQVAVLGCGGIGLAAIQGARTAGASRIIAVDPLAPRREAAIRSGATDVLEPQGALKAVRSLTGGGVDAAIECVGDTRVMSEAFDMIRAGGRCIVVGLPGYTDTLTLPAIMLLREKRIQGSIYGSANPSVDFARMADLAEQGRLDLGLLVDRIRPFSEIEDGFAEMRAGRSIRVVLIL